MKYGHAHQDNEHHTLIVKPKMMWGKELVVVVDVERAYKSILRLRGNFTESLCCMLCIFFADAWDGREKGSRSGSERINYFFVVFPLFFFPAAYTESWCSCWHSRLALTLSVVRCWISHEIVYDSFILLYCDDASFFIRFNENYSLRRAAPLLFVPSFFPHSLALAPTNIIIFLAGRWSFSM